MLSTKSLSVLIVVAGGMLVGACSSSSSSGSEPSLAGEEYIAALKEARTEFVVSAEGALLDDLGVDRVCHDHLLIDEIGEDTLSEQGVTPDNIGTYELETDILDDELFETLIKTCLDDIAATDSLVAQVGGEQFEPVVSCLIEEAGDVAELYLAVLNDEGFLDKTFEDGTCLDQA